MKKLICFSVAIIFCMTLSACSTEDITGLFVSENASITEVKAMCPVGFEVTYGDAFKVCENTAWTYSTGKDRVEFTGMFKKGSDNQKIRIDFLRDAGGTYAVSEVFVDNTLKGGSEGTAVINQIVTEYLASTSTQ